MIDVREVRAWAAVHATRPATLLTLGVAVLSPLFATTQVAEIGFVTLLVPLWTPLLLTLIASTGAALASVIVFEPALPDPPAAVAGRLAWALGWLALALTAANTWLVVGGQADVGAISRNVLIYTALGLLMSRVGQGRYVWLPSVAITLAAALFGYPEYGDRYYWWAVMLDEQATTAQMMGAVVCYLLALTNIVRPRRSRLRPPPLVRVRATPPA